MMNDLTEIIMIENNEISFRVNYKERSIIELYECLCRTSDSFLIHFIMNEVKIINTLISQSNILDTIKHTETIISLYRSNNYSEKIVYETQQIIHI
jgi:hypothetical protein